MSAKNLTCLSCGTVNRVPNERLSSKPKCGTCGQALNVPKVSEIDAATLGKASKRDQLPLVVDFWAPWCGPCRMMAPAFEQAAAELSPNVILAKLNTQDYPQSSSGFNISGIPQYATIT